MMQTRLPPGKRKRDDTKRIKEKNSEIREIRKKEEEEEVEVDEQIDKEENMRRRK